MNWLDLVILIFLAAFVIGGLVSGLIKSILSLVGLIVGSLLAGRFYIDLADRLSFISNQNAARIVAYILIFLVILIAASLLGNFLTKLVTAIHLGWLNRILGGVVGLIEGALFASVVLAVLAKYIGLDQTVSHSFLAQILLDRVPAATALLPSEFDSIRGLFQ